MAGSCCRPVMLTYVAIFGVFLFSSWVPAAARDCMIDDDKGWFDTSNVYSCEENSKCCKEYGNASCCAEKSTWSIVSEQLVLWGGLFGFLTFLGTVVYCRRKDFYVLEGGNPFAKLLGLKPKTDDKAEIIENDEKPSKA